MKKLGKILIISLTVLVVALAVVITFTIGWRPFGGPKTRPLTARKFESTPQRLERGRYLFTALAGCTDCHSQHKWQEHGAPVIMGTEGAGQFLDMPDLPGHVEAPNITPDAETGAGTWTDDQLARAIREGIGHDGRALFPMMPYQKWKNMSDEDVASVVVYLRSLPPVHHQTQPTQIIFPVKYLIRNAPEPVTQPVMSPNPSDQIQNHHLRDVVRRGGHGLQALDHGAHERVRLGPTAMQRQGRDGVRVLRRQPHTDRGAEG